MGSANFSSFDAFKPSVLGQSYILYDDVTALGVSDTRFGITSREVIGILTLSKE